MKLITRNFFSIFFFCTLQLSVGGVLLHAEQAYPPSSYQIDGSQLLKWLGTETEIDFTKDEVLSRIERITDGAFEGNTTLKSILLPPSLSEIWVNVFSGCTALEEVRFAEHEDNYYTDEQYLVLYENCFGKCPKLQKVYLPKHLKKMEEGVFEECSSLTSIAISSKHPFWRVENRALVTKTLPRTLVLLPPGITGNYTVHPQVSTIGRGAFNSSSLTSVFLPKSVETIEESAFYKAKLLRVVNFPIGLRAIKPWAFFGCSSLSTFVFPNTLDSIGYRAFARCPGLPEMVKLPAQIVYMDGAAFSDNPQVQAYAVEADNPNYMVEDGVLFNADRSCLVSMPSGRTAYQLPEGVSEIGSNAFRGSALKEIHFSPSLRIIGERAFFYCDSLKAILLPKGVQSLGASAFRKCNAVIRISLPSTLEQIGEYAFFRYAKDPSFLPAREIVCHIPSPLDCNAWDNYESDAKKMRKDTLYVPQEAVELYKIAPRWNLFASILPLKKEHEEDPKPIPYELSTDGSTLLHWFRGDKVIDFFADEKLARVRTIAPGAFAFNQNIEQITLSSTVETVAKGAFEQCIHLESIEASALQEIGECAFLGCTALGSIDFPLLSDIGSRAFSGCVALQTVSLPTICTIGAEVFGSCGSVRAVQLSDCITQIGTKAFWNCSSLRLLDIPRSEPPALGEEVFSGVPVKEVVLTIPPGAEANYRRDDQWKEFFSSSSSSQEQERGAIPSVTYGDGFLYVRAEGRKIEIYSLQGVLIFSQENAPSDRIHIGQLSRGVYIVRVDNQLVKILV